MNKVELEYYGSLVYSETRIEYFIIYKLFDRGFVAPGCLFLPGIKRLYPPLVASTSLSRQFPSFP